MYRKSVLGLFFVLAGFVSVAEDVSETTKNTPTPAKEAEVSTYSGLEENVLPAKDETDYWVIRSQAVNELTSFLTKKRAELKEKLAYFTEYLEQIGKTEDMLASNIEVKDDPETRAMALGIIEKLGEKNITLPKKPLEWDQLVEFSMKYIQNEGYSPIFIVDEDELESYKSVLKRNEQFCMKVRNETLGLVDKIVKAWVYLGTIEKQKDFRLYVLEQKKIKEQTRDEKRRAILDTQAEAARQRREMQKEAIAQEKQNRLQNQGYYY
jgi:hypothetical protein